MLRSLLIASMIVPTSNVGAVTQARPQALLSAAHSLLPDGVGELEDLGCELGLSPAGCVKVAEAFRRDGKPGDAITYFAAGCRIEVKAVENENLDDEALRFENLNAQAVACLKAGQAYAAGNTVKRDVAVAAELFGKGCNIDLAIACRFAGQLRSSSDPATGNPTTALILFDRACALTDAEGCFLLGMAQAKGFGAPADKVRAAIAFKRALLIDPSMGKASQALTSLGQ